MAFSFCLPYSGGFNSLVLNVIIPFLWDTSRTAFSSINSSVSVLNCKHHLNEPEYKRYPRDEPRYPIIVSPSYPGCSDENVKGQKDEYAPFGGHRLNCLYAMVNIIPNAVLAARLIQIQCSN